jgi:sugar transferase (PEP-CTERM/EpsH1 system associated)
VKVVEHGGLFRWVRALGSLMLGGSISEGAFWSPTLAGEVAGWCRQWRYSAAIASASSLGPYLELPEVRGLPAVVDLMDVDSQKWRDYSGRSGLLHSAVYSVEAARVEALERRLAARAKALLVVSEAEAELLRKAVPNAPVEVVPNGVDLEYFQASAEAGEGCVFVGALDYFPNVDGAVWFCREVWPLVIQRRPRERLRLVGRRPTDDVKRLGGVDGVEVVADVPDVRPYLAGAAVVVAPLRVARGIQNKVLEGMAMARPVVASPQALQGLRGRGEVPVVEACRPEAWAEEIVALLGDAARCRELGKQGRRFVEGHHAWGPCLAGLDELLARATGRHSGWESVPASAGLRT